LVNGSLVALELELVDESSLVDELVPSDVLDEDEREVDEPVEDGEVPLMIAWICCSSSAAVRSSVWVVLRSARISVRCFSVRSANPRRDVEPSVLLELVVLL